MNRGFTLLEVVIALAILAMSLTVLLAAQSSSYGNAARSRDISIASLLARSKMIDVEQLLFDEGFTEGVQNDDGDFSDEGHKEIKWTVQISQVELNLGGLTSLCGGLTDDDAASDPGAPNDCESMLSGFGSPMEGLLGDIGRSLRVIDLTVTWPVGGKYHESMTVRALITREDYAIQQAKDLAHGLDRLNALQNRSRP